MFGGEASEKKVKVLSGGEKSRLAMLRLLLQPVNLLILEIEVFETGFDTVIDIGDIRNRFLILALGEVWVANALEWAHELAAFWRGKVAGDVGWIRTFGSKRSAI